MSAADLVLLIIFLGVVIGGWTMVMALSVQDDRDRTPVPVRQRRRGGPRGVQQ